MATSIEDIRAILREVAEAQKVTERMFQETDRKFLETDRQIKETDRQFKETDRQFKETDRRFKETDRRLRELGKQIGGLGEKFGSFTEGLALPSMERLLRERFGMEVISPSVRVTKGDRHLELDVLSYANGPIACAYVVEVKSHLREEAITQLQDILGRFREFFPEHRDKRLFGILAAVDMSGEMRERVLKAGFYPARIHDQVFELVAPEGFEPRPF